ncbi:MAG TPA: ABC transporter substrate-binding protein [Candidatus Binataceae bacterium]|nr:ABC transporter substrate-binding protein [Candidatus Binataceae bacterium]
MRRREFMAGFGLAGAWSIAARAQQSIRPLIGYLTPQSSEVDASYLNAFKKGLEQAGYTDGQNVSIKYLSADGRFDRLSALAANLVREHVAVIVASSGTITALAAKGATSTIPIVFVTGGDPIKAGLVASLNRPGANLTGVNVIAGALNAKRLEVLHEVMSSVTTVGIMQNNNNPNADPELKEMQSAAQKLGIRLFVRDASTPSEIGDAFAEIVKQGAGALVVGTDPFLNTRVDQLVKMTRDAHLPAIYGFREFPAAGGLISYGTSATEARRQAGIYTARILNGEIPADLPVIRSTKIELVFNLRTAKALGISVPLSLLGRADEVIE